MTTPLAPRAMKMEIDGRAVFLACAGDSTAVDHRTLILVHGAGHDHAIWSAQIESLSAQGFRVIAPDLPGHGRSQGPALDSIDQLGLWTSKLINALTVRPVLVGHSMGALIALHAAVRSTAGVTGLVLVGCVAPMPVAPALLETARTDRMAAYELINRWSFAPATDDASASTRRTTLVQTNTAMMAAQAEGVLAIDLAACNACDSALAMAARVTCPIRVIGGELDRMTPLRAAGPLLDALAGNNHKPDVVTLARVGHTMMREDPDGLSRALSSFVEGIH